MLATLCVAYHVLHLHILTTSNLLYAISYVSRIN